MISAVGAMGHGEGCGPLHEAGRSTKLMPLACPEASLMVHGVRYPPTGSFLFCSSENRILTLNEGGGRRCRLAPGIHDTHTSNMCVQHRVRVWPESAHS